MIQEVCCYNLVYKLQMLPEYGDKTFEVRVPVIANSYGQARTIAEKWLEEAGHKVYKYTRWVGSRGELSEYVLIDDARE